jgi:hypothetical protein
MGITGVSDNMTDLHCIGHPTHEILDALSHVSYAQTSESLLCCFSG